MISVFLRRFGSRADRVRAVLNEKLRASHIDIMDESHKHRAGKGAESHFKVLVVSKEFDGQSPVERHRVVTSLLSEELSGGLHALSIVARTPEEWQPDAKLDPSPACRGGEKKH
eukprot:TRINITY_DN5314_c0_g2_i2.p1 TRINITY_DN5314_c0_g2~~TRINITY_DN5314_c0_g2_i2.p1  ORF type:complete len:114 (+),score=5.18 TRINITY_DN5314_c0_g2_i2:41-382(+)